MHKVALLVASLLALPRAQDLDARSSCPLAEPVDSAHALMQRRKDFEPNLKPQHGNHVQKQSSKVASLLAAEMEDLASSRGQLGLTPEEIEHINSIKDLIVGSILPSITDGVAETREEVQMLYDAVASCANHATTALQEIAGLETATDSNSDSHAACRKKEDELFEEKQKVCDELEKSKLGVKTPQLDFEVNMEISDAEMIRYLRSMDEHFCGRWSEFKEVWEECEDLTDNHTKTHDECTTLQEDLEESWCTWKSELEETCDEFNECWAAAVERYNERKEAIEALQETRLTEYKGALKVNCYWDAWKWDAEPCTIDEDKLEKCKEEYEPDLEEVLVEFPELPVPPECNTEPVSIYPCTEEYFAAGYETLGVSADLVAEMKEMCTQCPVELPIKALAAEPETPVLAVTRVALQAKNMESSGTDGAIYTKRSGEVGVCDGTLQSPESDLTSVKIRVMQGRAKGKLELFKGDDNLTLKFDHQLATVEGGGASGHTFTTNDVLSIEIEDGNAIFKVGSRQIGTLPSTFSKGTSKLTMCTMGASITTIDW